MSKETRFNILGTHYYITNYSDTEWAVIEAKQGGKKDVVLGYYPTLSRAAKGVLHTETLQAHGNKELNKVLDRYAELLEALKQII